MNLQQLHYFSKIAECQQYTQAARELHVTQATLSYAISNLEKELGVRLFERKGKILLLTDHGKAYLSCVREALHALQRGEQMLRYSTPQKLIVKLECLESVKHAALSMISDLCSDDDSNSFRLELSYSNAANIEQKLIRREIDLGISTMPATMGISSRLMGYQDNVVIVPHNHPWAKQETVSLSALKHHRFIAYNRECVIRDYYDSIFRSLHIQPEIFAESKTHSNILDMVAYGMGFAIVPRMRGLKDRQDLAVLEIQESIPARPIYLQWMNDSETNTELAPVLQKFIACPVLSLYL